MSRCLPKQLVCWPEASTTRSAAAASAFAGFVLGKPFWGKPTIRQDPSGGLSATQHTTGPAQQDDADEVLLSEGLGSQLLSIPGMDNFFTYQLEYKRVSGLQAQTKPC
jgi:hypothetical protein